MNILHNVVSNDIIYTFGGQGTQSALMVATLSLTNTVTFLTMLCALVDTIFAKTSRLLEIHCGTRMVFDNVNLQENSSGSLCSKRQSVRCDDNRWSMIGVHSHPLGKLQMSWHDRRQLSLNPDPENNSCSTQPISQKVVKQGFRPAAQPQKCVVSFEQYPDRLWSLRPCNWSHILITETDARRLRQFHMSTWTKFEHKIVAILSLLSPGNDAPLSLVDQWLMCLRGVASGIIIDLDCVVDVWWWTTHTTINKNSLVFMFQK